jgi:hypothetical protein
MRLRGIQHATETSQEPRALDQLKVPKLLRGRTRHDYPKGRPAHNFPLAAT